MTDAISIALSGMNAQKQRLAASASNIANATTSGRVPTAGNPASTVYRPLSVSLAALTSGGVQARVTEDTEGYSVIYDPTNIYANEEGLVAAPRVELDREAVNLLETKTLFRAGISVIKTEKEMLGALLDAIG